MDYDQVLGCVRMLYFEAPYDDYPYHCGGTGFLVAFNQEIYFFTAKHCLDNHKVTPDDVRVILHLDTLEFSPFEEAHAGSSRDQNDKDHADFVLMRVKKEMVQPEDILRMNSFEVVRETIISPCDPSITSFFTRGYPSSVSRVDYDAKHLKQRGFQTAAVYVGPDTTARHCYEFRAMRHPKVADLDGMSGSPVFAALPDGQGKEQPCLAGLIIRGGRDIFRAIGAEVLWKALHLAEQARIIHSSGD